MSRNMNYKYIVTMMSKSFIVILLLLISGCSEQRSDKEVKYYVLYSDDYSNLVDSSYIVAYDEDGIVVDEIEFDSAHYYNLIYKDDELVINNGKNIHTIKDMKVIESKDIDKYVGFQEIGRYNVKDNEITYLYNGGYGDDGIYTSSIERNNKEYVTNNYISDFNFIDSYIFICTRNDHEESYDIELTKLDFEILKVIESKIIISNIYGDDVIDEGSYSIDNNLMFMHTKRISENFEEIMYLVDINSLEVKEYDLKNKLEMNNLNLSSYFNHDGKAYFFNNDGTLINVSIINNEVIFEKLQCKLPKEFINTNYTYYKEGSNLYVYTTVGGYLTKISLLDYKINDVIKFSESSSIDDLVLMQ